MHVLFFETVVARLFAGATLCGVNGRKRSHAEVLMLVNAFKDRCDVATGYEQYAEGYAQATCRSACQDFCRQASVNSCLISLGQQGAFQSSIRGTTLYRIHMSSQGSWRSATSNPSSRC